MNLTPFSNKEWQAIIHLGNQLLTTPLLSDKVRVIQNITSNLLQCTAKIELIDARLLSLLNSSPDNIGTGADNNLGLSPHEECLIGNNLSHIEVPMIFDGSVIGFIRCIRRDRPFSKDEEELVEGIANQVTINLALFMVNYQTQQQVKRLLSITEISNVIASILDVDLLLSSVTSLIRKFYNIPVVYVFTIHQGQQQLQLRSESSDNIPDLDAYRFDLREYYGPLSQAIDSRHTIRSTNNSYNLPISQLYPLNVRSDMVVPLIFGEQVLGLLWLLCEQENAFDESDELLFSSLGDIIAVALRNANLYSTEQWRRRVTESMRDVAGLLSSEVDLNHLLNQLLEELTKTLPCETAVIFLIDNIEFETSDPERTLLLRKAALLTTNDDLYDTLENVSISSTEEWLANILENHYPVIRNPNSDIGPLSAFLGYSGDYSAIVSSLRIGLQPFGILVLSHPTPGRYGNEAQLITATFASYAAVAIKNMQLYHAAHDQAWVSTVLLQVAEATQSINNLDDLADTITHAIPQLLGVRACAILLWDKSIDTFVPTSSYGFSDGEQTCINEWYIPQHTIPIIDQMLTTHDPVVLKRADIPDMVAETSLYGFNLDEELMLMFPMVSHSENQGVILIDLSSDNHQEYEKWEEKYSILRGIARQTAVAIDNIRLIQSQEEEAYVSIALLQVAQAIVSAVDIQEVLSVVVRITPILVAMKRCAIYLWDFTQNTFHLSQTYGIPKADGIYDTSQRAEKFSLLDVARVTNQIIYYPIKSDNFTFADWCDISSDECSILGSVPTDSVETISLMTDVLSLQNRLLLAYPLSVKDNVYGVMIIEEEFSERGIPPSHIRERRIEIVTGITQQTALAIQNDVLQRDIVQRERLDRELQLAREIQLNFMPDKFPLVKGWDIDIRWIPARQVGGDYYDVFALPDGKIGIVIADVADKGMPAALFMTLVRTLLRATVRDNISPGESLCQVNELLVPDAKNGMFVTLVYGVLSPDSGKLVYVNAGHVPPLLIQTSLKGTVELFPCSMALGVLPGINIQEREITLLPGDSLVFYTDGVSEAFSPDGQMYGRDRLKKLMLVDDISSACQVTELITRTISEFSGGSLMSDDLTLIALHRQAEASQ